MKNNNAQQVTSKNRWIPYLLFAVFFVPLILSYVLYYSGAFMGEQGTQNGQLIMPPMQLSKLPLTDKTGQTISSKQFDHRWTLMYVSPKQCADVCTQNVYNMRQIDTALGKNQLRVQRYLVTYNPQDIAKISQQLQKKYPDTELAFTQPKAYKALLQQQPDKNIALHQGALYVVDPNGNIMMSYAPDAAARGVLKDLKKLLKVSQIG